MDRNDVLGAAQLAGGTYVGYQGIKHGLPRALGLRTEYHTTSKANAELIRKAGNVLDPAFGGKNGWAQKVGSSSYVKNSENYIHITGLHKDSVFNEILANKKLGKLTAPIRTLHRKLQCLMYKTVGNVDMQELKELKMSGNSKDVLKTLAKEFKKGLFHNKTKKFCIAGTDSYFNSKFIPDVDDIALKSADKLKVYNNRFSAMVAGLKKFGLKGVKENKGRVAFGVGLLTIGTYFAAKLIKKGVNNICQT